MFLENIYFIKMLNSLATLSLKFQSPYCAISSPASVQNVLTDNPLSVAENRIATITRPYLIYKDDVSLFSSLSTM